MKKILIVDDAKDSRAIITNLLKDYSYQIIEAKDGLEGWKLIIKERPDLVLLDLHMPNKDGFDILKDLEEEWLGIPIVIISGDNSQSTIDTCLTNGASAYVQKPIIANDFNETIKILCA